MHTHEHIVCKLYPGQHISSTPCWRCWGGMAPHIAWQCIKGMHEQTYMDAKKQSICRPPAGSCGKCRCTHVSFACRSSFRFCQFFCNLECCLLKWTSIERRAQRSAGASRSRQPDASSEQLRAVQLGTSATVKPTSVAAWLGRGIMARSLMAMHHCALLQFRHAYRIVPSCRCAWQIFPPQQAVTTQAQQATCRPLPGGWTGGCE